MSQYLEALRQAMVIYPIIIVLFTVPYIAWSYHKYGSVLSLRVLIVYSFILYLLCVYCLVILPLPTPEKAATLHGHKAQLIPFSFIADIAKQAQIQPGQPASWLSIFTGSAFWTTVFNLFMTMPFGVYLRYGASAPCQSQCFPPYAGWHGQSAPSERFRLSGAGGGRLPKWS